MSNLIYDLTVSDWMCCRRCALRSLFDLLEKEIWHHLNTFVHQDIHLKKALVMKTLTIYMLF